MIITNNYFSLQFPKLLKMTGRRKQPPRASSNSSTESENAPPPKKKMGRPPKKARGFGLKTTPKPSPAPSPSTSRASTPGPSASRPRPQRQPSPTPSTPRIMRGRARERTPDVVIAPEAPEVPAIIDVEEDSRLRRRLTRPNYVETSQPSPELSATSQQSQLMRHFRAELMRKKIVTIREHNATQYQHQRSRLSPERADEIRRQHASHERERRSRLSPERADEIRRQDASQHQQRRSQLPPPVVAAVQQQNAAQHRDYRALRAQREAEELRHFYRTFMTPNPREEVIDPPRFNEFMLDEQSVGPMDEICQHCFAQHFEGERTTRGEFTNCCRHGRVILPQPLRPYPPFLRSALTDPADRQYRNFREEIRSYNSSLSFVTLGANITPPPGQGSYVFAVTGQMYHYMQQLEVRGDENKRYAQLYILDSTTQATDIRMEHPANANLDRDFLRRCTEYIQQYNAYAETFAMCRDYIHSDETVELVFNREYMPGIHLGRQNAPVAENEVAAVFVLDNEDGVPNLNRDFAVYVKKPNNQIDQVHGHEYVKPTSQHLLPLTYPLLFPNGERGWHITYGLHPDPEQRQPGDRRISMQQFYSAMLQVRPTFFSPVLHAANLTQQFIVDAYCSVESNNLEWIRMNQDTLRARNYVALQNFVDREAQRRGLPSAPAVILPSTFTGSDRNMRQLCLDAMSIFARHGRPDLFLTFTCNPKWKDITDNLLPGEKPHDRPDIVSRVFSLKLKEFIDDITVSIFGKVTCWVYTIEYQKRGLPHAHILVSLEAADKPTSEDDIDNIVCAEIPDKNANPELYAIVTSCMIHGPCREGLCLDEHGRCKKGFPKKLLANTEIVDNSYPNYRRRIRPPTNVRGRYIDNRYVVPYNPYLTKKYNAHINVEVVTFMKSSIKYLYKYVFKGFDVASLSFRRNGAIVRDEVKTYINCRYVSAPESMWRLYEYKMHHRSHAVTRLPIHFDNAIEVVFDEGMEEVPEREPETLNTMLNAFFLLNRDPANNSRHLYYRDIPEHFVYNSRQRRWNTRQRRGDKMVGRIRDVNANNVELFAMRLLLLNVKGPQSYEHLRTINGVVYETFKQAAQQLNLIRDDAVFYSAFDDLGPLQMSPQIRQMFAILLQTYTITSAMTFWTRYRHMMIDDFRRMPQNRNLSDDELYEFALHDLNTRFSRTGRSNSTFGLPMPQGPPPPVVQPPPAPVANVQPIKLNEAQQSGFDKIMNAVHTRDDLSNKTRCFVVIGPGGSGKTTLYKEIIKACKQENLKVRVFATTGIAATLMEGGMTVHSGFGIPVPLTPESNSRLLSGSPNSRECEELRLTDVFLIDEITMLVKDGLRIVDSVLRFVTGINESFGRKIVVVGGDFRQLLPVVPRGSRTAIIAECVISSPLWRHFKVIMLTQNMRAVGDTAYGEWLLKLGTGTLDCVNGLEDSAVEIFPNMLLNVQQRPQLPRARNDPDAMPAEMCAMIETIFGQDVNQLTTEDLTSRAILASTIHQVMKINTHLIDSLNGQAAAYLSTDTLESDDPNDERNFPVEYLNDQQPSGFPPHLLVLKKGVVVMLLRNMDPHEGLSNGTRLIIKDLLQNAISAEIISECHRGDIVFIPRMDLTTRDPIMGFVHIRRQFPLLPAYAMTINKSQGQTIERVGIYLNDSVFAHGQLYVAMSRCRERKHITVFVKEQRPRQGQLLRDVYAFDERVFTRNIVYREVFVHGELRPLDRNLASIDPELAQILDVDEDDIDQQLMQLHVSQPMQEDEIQPVLQASYEDNDYGDDYELFNPEVVMDDNSDDDGGEHDVNEANDFQRDDTRLPPPRAPEPYDFERDTQPPPMMLFRGFDTGTNLEKDIYCYEDEAIKRGQHDYFKSMFLQWSTRNVVAPSTTTTNKQLKEHRERLLRSFCEMCDDFDVDNYDLMEKSQLDKVFDSDILILFETNDDEIDAIYERDHPELFEQ